MKIKRIIISALLIITVLLSVAIPGIAAIANYSETHNSTISLDETYLNNLYEENY